MNGVSGARGASFAAEIQVLASAMFLFNVYTKFKSEELGSNSVALRS